jgi:oligosaccharide repeat unit polymerase
VPLLALPTAHVNPVTAAYILFACVAFACPTLVVPWGRYFAVKHSLAGERKSYLDSPFIFKVFVGSCAISVLFILVDVVVQGITLADMVFRFFASSNAYLELRYEGELTRNMFGQWGLVLAYIAATTGGLVHASPHRRLKSLVLAAALLPSVLILLIQAAKGLFFVCIALVLGAHWIYRTLADTRPHVDIRAAAGHARYIVVAIPLIVLSFMSRGLYEIDETGLIVERLLSYLKSYAFLHLYSFSDWFSYYLGLPAQQSYSIEPPAFGFYTFVAPFRVLGSDKFVPPGVYAEYFSLEGVSPGNIYTIFRGLITDFGIPGSLVALWACGYVVTAFYRQMLLSRSPAVSVGVMFIFVQALYTSYIVSVFIWNATFVVSVVTIMVLIINRVRHGGSPLPVNMLREARR